MLRRKDWTKTNKMSTSNDISSLEKQIIPILKEIKHPSIGKDLITGEMFKGMSIQKDGRLLLGLSVGNDRQTQISLEANIRTAISKKKLDHIKVRIQFEKSDTPNAPSPTPTSHKEHGIPEKKQIENVKYVIAVGSGKGGVGKSTVSLNLASTISKKGYKVGLLDADIYGPSLGKLINLTGKVNLKIKNNKIIPIQKYNMKIMSFSFLIDEDQAVVWRGPMLGKAIEQFLYDIKWDELDYLIIDLPPGTGDIQLSLSQLTHVHGAVLVTTPQDVAVQDAVRAAAMFSKVDVPIIGIVENMSEFICPHCEQKTGIFSKGGGERIAKKINAPLLGRIPFCMPLMISGERGVLIREKKEIKKLAFNKQTLEIIETAFDTTALNIHSILEESYQ